MTPDQQNPMEAMANKACRQCTRIMNRCCTNGVCHWWCVDCRIRVDVEQKPMSVEDAKRQCVATASIVHLNADKEINSLIAAVRADTETKVRAEIAGQMVALAGRWDFFHSTEWPHPSDMHRELQQLAAKVGGKQ